MADFDPRTQTICAIIQTTAIVIGVGFAVVQLSQSSSDRDQRRLETTHEELKRLDQEPLAPIVEFVRQTLESGLFAGLPWMPVGKPVGAAEFEERTKPLTAFFGNIERGVENDIYDRDMSAAAACPIALSYHYARIKTRGEEPDMWSTPTAVPLGICPTVKWALRFSEGGQ